MIKNNRLTICVNLKKKLSWYWLIAVYMLVNLSTACDSNNAQAKVEEEKDKDRISITGTFTELKNTPLRIKISKGFAEAPIFGDTTDTKGSFTLYYPADYKGIGIIEIYKGAEIPIILNGQALSFTAPNANNFADFNFGDTTQNDAENEALKNYLSTELQWLSAIVQTENYKPADKDYALAQQIRTKANLDIQQSINALPDTYYLKDYLKLRFKIQGMRVATQVASFDNQKYIEEFKDIDLTGEAVQSCACSEDILTNVYQLVEGQDLDKKAKTKTLNQITEHIINQVSVDEDQFILAGTFIYNMFESKNYTDANEHLSLLILEGEGCAVDDTKDVTRRFEQYRKMKVGKTAPDINVNDKQSLYQLNNAYKLVVFWASWCAHCMQEIPQLQKMYADLKKADAEVIAISLDTDKNEYNKAVQSHQWLSYCDFKRWESPAAKDYYVSTTPALFLLNSNNEIVAKPKSVYEVKRFLKL